MVLDLENMTNTLNKGLDYDVASGFSVILSDKGH